MSFDTRNMLDDRREALAWKVHNQKDFQLPHLDAWNYDLCRQHRGGWTETVTKDGKQIEHTVTDRPMPGCRKCAIHFHKHQRVSIAWLYLRKRALLADTMGTGKGHPLSEPVLTPRGWTTIGDLGIGDRVIGRSGQATQVTGLFPLGERDIYKVTFSDGATVQVTDDHLWSVRTPDDKRLGKPWRTLTTSDLMSRGVKARNGNRKWYVPLVAPVEFAAHEEFLLDPYALGVLLGDGGFTGPGIMLSTDHDIVQSLDLPGDCLPILQTQKDVAYSADYRLNGMVPFIRDLGLFGKKSEDKFVPDEYMLGSAAERLALLQGLLDTDGTPNAFGVEFGTVSHTLALQVQELVRSLGGLASITEKTPTYTHNGEKRQGQLFFRMYLRIPVGLDPFRLKRKAEKYQPSNQRDLVRGIESIEFSHCEEAQCIRVEAEDHLYVTTDYVVTHNTTSAGGLIAMMLQTGELADPRDGGVGRVIITPRAPALHQWHDELKRMMPGLNIIMAQGPKEERNRAYAQEWQVLLIGPEMLLNDADKLERIPLAAFITDDIDTIRNPDNRQAYTIKKLGRRADRFVMMTGTPLQKKLPELHSVLDPIGGLEVFGSLENFTRRYIRTDSDSSYDPNLGRRVTSKKIVGYKKLDEVKRKMAPMVLRRTADQLDDVHMPAILTSDVMLDLYPAQRAAYKELQTGVIQLLREEGEQTKHVTALSKIHYGAQICGGLATLHGPEQDGPGTSVKLDWIEEKLTGELENEKVVIFANYKNSVRALQDRFRKNGVGFTTVWGEDPNKERRRQSQERFWEDKRCRVLIGTRAIEQSLNLQVSRHLINMDLIMNPARMEQLAGRVRRNGSAFNHVYVHNLLTIDTQEERYLPALEREAALAGFIWGENSQLFQALTPTALLHLISG